MNLLTQDFYNRDTVQVARDLLGKHLVRVLEDGTKLVCAITETEAYIGRSDKACHAYGYKRTKRTETLFAPPGTAYIYLCYGIHWMLNVVTDEVDVPCAVLIRACAEAPGPGRLTKALGITGELNRTDITESEALWIEDDGCFCTVETARRVGIGYAGEEDQARLWRFIMK